MFLQTLIVVTAFMLRSMVLPSPVPVIFPASPDGYHSQSLQSGGNVHELAGKHTKQAMLDVKSTIEQVQKLLEADPKLPRLTRGEIEDLFEQVTKEEYDKSIKSGDKVRAKHMRALMLVLPYNTDNNSTDDLQELYNRPPITKVISTEKKIIPKPEKITVPSGKVEIIAVDANPTTYKPIVQLQTAPIVTTPLTTTTMTNFLFNPAAGDSVIIGSTLPTYTDQSKLTTGRFSSHYNAKETNFYKSNQQQSQAFVLSPNIDGNRTNQQIRSGTSKSQITPELEELLASLGFPRKSQSKKRSKLDNPLEEELVLKPVISSLIKQDPLAIDEFYPVSSVSISGGNFKKSMIPSIKPQDFVAFKPIPTPNDSPKNLQPELEDYLKMFGIVDNDKSFRSEKSLSLREVTTEKVMVKIPNVQSDMIPGSYSNIIRNIGIPIENSRIDLNIVEPIKNTFNPLEHHISDAADFEKLQGLLETIRALERLNVNLTEDDLEKLDLKNFNLSKTLLAQGPNPIEEDQPNSQKNEIKRQTESPEPTRYSLDLSVVDTNDKNQLPVIDPLVDELFAVSSESADINASSSSDANTNSNDPRNTVFASENLTNSSFEVESTNNEIGLSFPPTITETTTTALPVTTKTEPVSTTQESRNGQISDLADSFPGGLDPITEQPLPPPRRNGFYFLADWNSFLEVGEDPDKVIVRFDPKVGDPSRFIPVNVP